MSSSRSYAVLAGQLLLVLAGAVLVAVVVQALGGPAPHVGVLAAGVGTALVVASAKQRRLEGTAADPALAGCRVRIPLDRWPVGGVWQSRLLPSTRAGWAPGLLGLGPDLAVFAPSHEREADRAWQDAPRAVQLRPALAGRATMLRVHGRHHGTVQLVAQLPAAQVREAVEQVLPVTEGWDEAMTEPDREWEPRLSERRMGASQFSVRLLLVDSTETRVEVVTLEDGDKAEAIARRRYDYLHPDGPAVREAVVVDLGVAPLREDGFVDLTGKAFDREEW